MPDDRIDYVALATRIRASRRVREARIDEQRPAKERDPSKLALDDALDLLQSGAVDDVLKDVARELKQQIAVADAKPADPFSVGPHRVPLADQFLDNVLDYYRDAYEPFVRDGDDTEQRRRLPQAVVTALAGLARDDGFVDAQQAQQQAQQLGPLGARVLQRLLVERDARRDRAPTPHGNDSSSKNTGKYQGLSMAVAHKVALSKQRDGYLERMPVVAELCRMLGGPHKMRGMKMASVQHLFPSAMALYESLFSAGLVPTDAHVGGKYYSANVNTVARMDARGMVLHTSATDEPDGVADAEQAVREMARDELQAMFYGVDPSKETERRFLLLDDGGKLIEALHEHFPEYAHLCVAVEQTTRGVQVLEKMKAAGKQILCPVINMAGADLKRTVESPLIAASVVWHVDRYLKDLDVPDKLPRPPDHKPTAVVVGFGATGAATAEALRRRGYHVVVTDKDQAKCDAAIAAGFDVKARTDAFALADVLVGSTGMGALDRDEWGLVKAGAVMVNAASGNHELGIGELGPHQLAKLDPARRVDAAGKIATRFQGRTLTTGRATDDARLEHRVLHAKGADGKDKELLFLRGGSVVNMEHDLPPEFRQIIVGMLLACCFQAVGEERCGLVDFDAGVQSFLRTRFERALAELGLSWQQPDLDAVQGPWG